MKTFQVWIRPLGEACRVRVDGLENGRWLLARLIETSGIKRGEPTAEGEPFGLFTFLVALSPTMTRSMLGEWLAAIPEVNLTFQLA